MRKFLTRLALLAVILSIPYESFAQAANKPAKPSNPDSEQTLRDILNEVRQLRADLLRISGNINRSQVLLDRVRVQQEMVVSLTRDFGDIHGRLDEIRARRQKRKAALEEAQKLKDAGLKGDKEVKDIADEVDELDKQEQSLTDRESRFATELNSAEASLADLNARLDKVERELAEPAGVQDAAPAKRPQ